MWILLRLLTLFACGPLLLLPAGTCVCEFVKSVTDGHPDHSEECHCPDCPTAVAVVERAQAGEPTADPACDFPLPSALFASYTPPISNHTFTPAPPLGWSSIPLYLSHCALVL